MRKSWLVLLALALVMAACGGDDDSSGGGTTTTAAPSGGNTTTTAAPDSGGGGGDTTTAAPSGGEATTTAAPDNTGGGGGQGPAFADVTIDGTAVRYQVTDLVYSPFEGIDDVTVEKCDPEFFSVGFIVIGFPVDGNGDVITNENGIAGGLELELPFPGTAPDLLDVAMSISYDELGLDRIRYQPDSESTIDYTIDGNRATGTATLVDFAGTHEITFDVTCPAG